MTSTSIKTTRYQSPAGELLLGEYEGRLCLCDWTSSVRHPGNLRRLTKHLHCSITEQQTDVLQKSIEQLQLYFGRKQKTFDLDTLLCGTGFQKSVWETLSQCQYGQTLSYKHIAEAIGRPGSVRAVAGAIGANPLSIIVPCHRIVGSDGSLTGYAGGLEAKRVLLDLERAHMSDRIHKSDKTC